MKGYLFITAIACGLPFVVNAQNDIYYIPSKNVHEVITTTKNSDDEPSYESRTVKYYMSNRNVDEYNRRGGSNASNDDTSSYQQEDQNVESSIDNYSCSKRIMRFHGPVVGVISSPYYWDICYGDNWDVYYDDWAYVLPSWNYWTYAYDPWSYNRWWYRTCWDYTWGWYDSWWGSYYWGWGNPCYWGWNRPYYGGWTYGRGGGRDFDRRDRAPGFGHSVGGGRMFTDNGATVTRGSAGGWIRQGGTNYRSMNNNGNSTTTAGFNTNRGLSKSFRTSSFGGDITNNQNVRTGGGGFSRSNSGGYSRSSSYSRSRNNYTPSNRNSNYSNRTDESTQQRTRTYTPSNNESSRSYSPSSSSSRGGSFGGGSGSTGGGSRGGGGFSRGGGGHR